MLRIGKIFQGIDDFELKEFEKIRFDCTNNYKSITL